MREGAAEMSEMVEREARAAIAAMREPTETMVEAGFSVSAVIAWQAND